MPCGDVSTMQNNTVFQAPKAVMYTGGVLKPKGLKKVSTSVTVSWSWHDQNQGIVQWTFTNNGNSVASVVLYRNGYYFGQAFYPIYLNYPQFNTGFITSLQPYTDNGVENNSPLYGVVKTPKGYMIMFVFVLGPGQTWSMLEGGFSGFTPSNVQLYDVTPSESPQQFCIGYNEQQVVDWDVQTETSMVGYTPNPNTFQSLLFEGNETMAYVQLFSGDTVTPGQCSTVNCDTYLQEAISEIEQRKFGEAFKSFEKYVRCKM